EGISEAGAKSAEELEPLGKVVGQLSEKVQDLSEELFGQDEKIRYILENMPSGIVAIDNRFQILLINAAAQELLEEPQVGEGSDLFHLTREKAVILSCENALRGNVSTSFDVDMSDSTGRILSVSISSMNNRWIKKGAVLFLTDVTQKRMAELMRSEFIANVSHELKTPITSIKGFSELLSAGVVTDKTLQADYLRRIHTEADRMGNLIEDILKLSHLEAKDEKEKRPVSIEGVVRDIFAALQLEAEKDEVRLLEEMAHGIAYMAEYEDIYQLLSNLIRNALKYNRPGGMVKVSAVKEKGLLLKIEDTGIGIAPQHQTRIFERFYRVDKGRSRHVGGTGLGLAIVKHIVLKYNGELTLESAEDQGTAITILLPKQGLASAG
ncbi:sensor histidine kinase, partial [Candidatus Soleaferrea massiliensis]|uniref:sensor histidine kinase n=1 Tax=Candidatus Soleaferrea massiliensis TaxID=1470354 RepID=UPI0012E068B9